MNEIKGIKEIGIYKDGTVILIKNTEKPSAVYRVDEVLISDAKIKDFEVEINNEIGPIGLKFHGTFLKNLEKCLKK